MRNCGVLINLKFKLKNLVFQGTRLFKVLPLGYISSNYFYFLLPYTQNLNSWETDKDHMNTPWLMKKRTPQLMVPLRQH